MATESIRPDGAVAPDRARKIRELMLKNDTWPDCAEELAEFHGDAAAAFSRSTDHSYGGVFRHLLRQVYIIFRELIRNTRKVLDVSTAAV